MRAIRQVIDARLFVMTTFGILSVGRIAALSMPSDVYFTFQSLFSDRHGPNIALALVVKMLPPAICGSAAGFLLYSIAQRQRGMNTIANVLSRRLRCIWAPTLLTSGFFASFLSAWPNMAYWDLVSDPSVSSLKPVFFAMYLLYMVSFGYVTLLGSLLMIYWRERYSSIQADRSTVSARELGRVGALWLVNSGIASAVLKYVAP